MRILAVVGALAIIAGVSAAVFFFGGFYSVAGTVEDPAIVRWALIQVRTASIDRHAVIIANGIASAGPPARNSTYGIAPGCVAARIPSVAQPSSVCGHRLRSARVKGTA